MPVQTDRRYCPKCKGVRHVLVSTDACVTCGADVLAKARPRAVTAARVAEGERRREAEGERVGEHAPDEWTRYALAAVRQAARSAEEFTTDEPRAELERRGIGDPPEPRAWGAVMREAASRGWCEATDQTRPTERPDAHRRPVRVWRSLVYARQEAAA